MQPYPMRSSRVTGSRSSSLYAGMTTERDFVASAKIEGGGTCRICSAVEHKCICIVLTGNLLECCNAKVMRLVGTAHLLKRVGILQEMLGSLKVAFCVYAVEPLRCSPNDKCDCCRLNTEEASITGIQQHRAS